jgi:energy-coupling factor transport system permease protein
MLLLVLAVLLPQLSLLPLVSLMVVLLLACFQNGQLATWWSSFLRLKWLLISIALLYGWFTPGLPLVEVVSVNMPTREGLWLALERSLLLGALVAAVTWLVKPLSAAVLATALTRLLSPLTALGIRIDVFAQRLALTLNAVTTLQEELAQRGQRDWQARFGKLILAIERDDLVVASHEDGEVLVSPIWLDGLRFALYSLLFLLVSQLPRLV